VFLADITHILGLVVRFLWILNPALSTVFAGGSWTYVNYLRFKITAVNNMISCFQMGFTENAYPSLLEKVKLQVGDGNLTKEREDDIVTTLLEELLTMAPTPKPAVASGSGPRRDRDIPGAWH
jgi:hypothetical protein